MNLNQLKTAETGLELHTFYMEVFLILKASFLSRIIFHSILSQVKFQKTCL